MEATSGSPSAALLITAGYELLVLFATACIIFHGVFYKRRVCFPGTSPSHFLQDCVLKPLEGLDNKGKYTVGWYLWHVQEKIMENTMEQKHEVKIYRRALILILIGFVSGAVLFPLLLFIL